MIAVVLGTGWEGALRGRVRSQTPMLSAGLPMPRVAGHAGVVQWLEIDGIDVLALRGRVHLHEGFNPHEITAGVRFAVKEGAERIVLTNACGALAPYLPVGAVVAISDHLNLTGRGLTGAGFTDMADAYSPKWRAALGFEGDLVYACVPGPQYETPAEAAMLRALGADVVGMSTVHETMQARALGAEVLGLSLVTDVAGASCAHDEVLGVGQDSTTRCAEALAAALAA